MNKINYILLALIVLIALISPVITNYQYSQDKEQTTQFKSLSDPRQYQFLGKTDYGFVIKSGPYGNPNSARKIALIVGVHPLEINSHSGIVESLKMLSNSLDYSYYIYSVYVTKDRDSYNNGRMNGQLLAKTYIVEDIKKNNFDLAIDIHSNRGLYQEKRFVCVPINDQKSKSTAFKLKNKISWLVYYLPPKEKGPSSPNYVTVPLIESGTPSMVYETYKYESYFLTLKHASEFILNIDNLN